MALTVMRHGRGPAAELGAARTPEKHFPQLLHFQRETPVLRAGILLEVTLVGWDKEDSHREKGPDGEDIIVLSPVPAHGELADSHVAGGAQMTHPWRMPWGWDGGLQSPSADASSFPPEPSLPNFSSPPCGPCRAAPKAGSGPGRPLISRLWVLSTVCTPRTNLSDVSPFLLGEQSG